MGNPLPEGQFRPGCLLGLLLVRPVAADTKLLVRLELRLGPAQQEELLL